MAADRHSGRHRTIRGVPDDLWEDCVTIARAKTGDERGGLSAEIRDFLVRYRSRNRDYLRHAATPDS